MSWTQLGTEQVEYPLGISAYGGNVYVSYVDVVAPYSLNVYCAKWDGSSWSISDPGAKSQFADPEHQGHGIFINPANGNIFIPYITRKNIGEGKPAIWAAVGVAKWDGSSWTKYVTEVMLSSEGDIVEVYLSPRASTNGAFYLLVQKNETEFGQMLFDGLAIRPYATLATTASDYIGYDTIGGSKDNIIICFNSGSNNVKLASFVNGGTYNEITTIANSYIDGRIGGIISVAANEIYISVVDYTTNTLKILKRNGSSISILHNFTELGDVYSYNGSIDINGGTIKFIAVDLNEDVAPRLQVWNVDKSSGVATANPISVLPTPGWLGPNFVQIRVIGGVTYAQIITGSWTVVSEVVTPPDPTVSRHLKVVNKSINPVAQQRGLLKRF